jgi:arylsulfatase A-like enzyme
MKLLSFLLMSLVPIAAVPEKSNVIVIFTDDQGYADLSCQGRVADIRTPHIDRLAARGVRLTDGYITAPQCVPSRAGLITGQYQQRFGVDANGKGPLPLSVQTLPERLRAAGYATGMVGKWHLQPNHSDSAWLEKHGIKPRQDARRAVIPAEKSRPYLPGSRGFSDFFHGHFSTYTANYDLQGRTLKDSGEKVDTGLYRLDAQTEGALAFVRRHAAHPFFLYLAYFAPHVPLEATAKYLQRFPGPMPERRRHALAMMSAIDDGVGRLQAELERLDIARRTLVFFISDNGAPLKIDKEDRPISFKGGAWDGSLNDPWVGEKGMLTEGGIRVPFVMTWPGVLPAGAVYSRPVISLDVAATTLALAGLASQTDLDGVNLIPYLTGAQSGVPHETLYWRFWNQAAIRRGNWKYLQAGTSRYLFDLSSPDHEKHNLHARYPTVAADLQAELAAWADGLHDPGLPEGKLNAQEETWYAHYLKD